MFAHTPVLLAETLEILSPKSGDRVLDVTLGLGGHSEAFLQKIGTNGSLTALDADTENIASAAKRLEPFGSRVQCIHANFAELPDCLPKETRTFDIIFADLGLSSPHIDDPTRGFTFRVDSPLDMRFDRTSGMTAALLLASLDPIRLLKIFHSYGEFPRTRSFVDAIVARRKDNPVRTSKDLVDTATLMYGYKAPQYLPQIFQALRIAVNNELEALEQLLSVIPDLLSPNGRCAIMSYHSLEDTLVKSSFRSLVAATKDPFTGSVLHAAQFQLLTKKIIVPTENEVLKNPRARSARLRAITKCPEYTSP